MKNKVTIIDYGLGNLLSISRALEILDYDPVITNSKSKIENSSNIILPGVGSFQKGIENIDKYSLREAIVKFVKKGNNLLGICLGMQLFFDESEESKKKNKGLGLIEGKILGLENKIKNKAAKVPHIGWSVFNKLPKKNSIFVNINKKDYMYFVHSFFADPKNKNNVIASTKYFNLSIPSVVNHNNVTGFQFHPEKSGNKGLQLLKNYLKQ